jgi:hypothetical protein
MRYVFLFIISINQAAALEIKAGYLGGTGNGSFGQNRTEGVTSYSLAGHIFSIEHDFQRFFVLLDIQRLKVNSNKSIDSLQDFSHSLFVGKKFGSRDNYLSLMLGISPQTRIFGTVDSMNEIKLESKSGLSLVSGFRINSKFLSYDFVYNYYPQYKLDIYKMNGKMLSHRVSLNFGKKFKYGLFYLTERSDLGGDYINWRSTDFLGLYIGWKFRNFF